MVDAPLSERFQAGVQTSTPSISTSKSFSKTERDLDSAKRKSRSRTRHGSAEAYVVSSSEDSPAMENITSDRDMCEQSDLETQSPSPKTTNLIVEESSFKLKLSNGGQVVTVLGGDDDDTRHHERDRIHAQRSAEKYQAKQKCDRERKGKKIKKEKKNKRILDKIKPKDSKKKNKKNKKKKKKKGCSSSCTSSSLPPASELTEALTYDKIFLAKYLVNKHGVHLYDGEGEGPLHCAARLNKTKFVSWFITQPGATAALDAPNARGETALLLATKLLHGTIALSLIRALADPGVVDNEGLAAEVLDLDALLQKAERAESATSEHFAQSTDGAKTFQRFSPVQRQVASHDSRHDAEWGQRLFSEMMEDEFDINHEVFAGYDDLERQDEADDDSWMDDIAFQYQERKRQETRARMEERLRFVMQAREEARRQADAQEAKARLDAQRRAASDAEFQKRWRQSQPQKDAPSASAQGRGDRGRKRSEANIATRADDDVRWRAFEDRIQKLDKETGSSPVSQTIGYKDIPWPSGPPGNPLHIDPSGHPAVLRSQIRAGLLRWHPDKFEQRVGRFLSTDGAEKERALAQVKELAQQLNRLMTELVANSSEAA